jgi:hypothetical protein
VGNGDLVNHLWLLSFVATLLLKEKLAIDPGD